jgi:hypothetical protein
MIIKYGDTLILSEWDDGHYGCYRRRNDMALVIISSKERDINPFVDKEKMSNQDKDHYKVQFLYDLKHLDDIYQNKIIEDTLQNIKNDVDCFLIRMSKIRVLT